MFQFPYYIVRFKQTIETNEDFKKIEFPYYIVRFKHTGAVSIYVSFFFVSILHSTI